VIDRAIATLAHRQRGYVTRPQLLELGLGPDAIKYRLKVGRLIRVYAGVYAVGRIPTWPVDRAAAAVLACGPGAVLSHGSAAALWGSFRRWDFPFEVTARDARRRKGIRVHRSTTLTRRDITTQLGVRVTSPARTLLDIAPRVSDKTLTRAVNDARIARHLHLSRLAELLCRCPRHPGAARLRRFVERPNGPTRSEFEDAFVEFTARHGLPVPQVNATVDGREVDAWFEAERLIVELDGYGAHSTKDAFETDRERDAANLAADRETFRITWDRMMQTPDTEARRLHAIVARRRGLGS
jgi:hypothetical protein